MIPIVEVQEITGSTMETAGEHRSHGEDRSHQLRWVGWIAIAVSVLPIWVAVVRNGMHGLFPYGDGANTVLRAKDVFDGPFPLVGMPAAGGSQAGYEVYFPGAWQLYAIAIPTRLFGVVWGPLLAMGVLNTAWTALAGWLLLRRLRLAEGLVGIAFLSLLSWSIGSGFLISPVPMQMVMVPMALFLVAVWAVADGDPVALPILAVVANYLWLGHLVLVLTVPMVAACAVVGFLLWFRRARRVAVDRPGRIRGARRGLITAAVITAVMWVPTLIQQFTTSPGNLRLLMASAGAERPIIGSWARAIRYVSSLIGRPPFWFRGTLDDPPDLARRSIGKGVVFGLPIYDAVIGLLVVSVGVVLAVCAWRRRDRTGFWLLIVAGAGVVAAVVTTHSAPTFLGAPHGYLRSVWVIAMFVWLAIGVNLLRLVRGRIRWGAGIGALGVVIVCTVLNFPTAAYGYGAGRSTHDAVKAMNAQVIPELAGRGTFQVVDGGLAGHRYGAALRLGMTEAGVSYCFPSYRLRSDGSRPECPDELAGVVVIQVKKGLDQTVKGEVLLRHVFLDDDEWPEMERLDARVQEWLESVGRLRLTPQAAQAVVQLGEDLGDPQIVAPLYDLLELEPAAVARLRHDPTFQSLVRLWHSSGERGKGALFEGSSLSPAEWKRWINDWVDVEVLFVFEKR